MIIRASRRTDIDDWLDIRDKQPLKNVFEYWGYKLE